MNRRHSQNNLYSTQALTGYGSVQGISKRLGSCNHQRAGTENAIHIVFIYDT